MFRSSPMSTIGPKTSWKVLPPFHSIVPIVFSHLFQIIRILAVLFCRNPLPPNGSTAGNMVTDQRFLKFWKQVRRPTIDLKNLEQTAYLPPYAASILLQRAIDLLSNMRPLCRTSSLSHGKRDRELLCRRFHDEGGEECPRRSYSWRRTRTSRQFHGQGVDCRLQTICIALQCHRESSQTL